MQYNPYGYPGYTNNIQSGTDFQSISWVSNFDEVKATHVPFGRHLFMHKNEDMFSVKDNFGNIKMFEFTEVPLPSDNPKDYVSRKEFDELKEKYEQLISTQPVQSVQQPAQQVQPVVTYANNAADQQLPGNATASPGAVLQPNSINGSDQIATQQPIG